MDGDVNILLEVKAGEHQGRLKIEADRTMDALDGISLLVMEFARKTGIPVVRVLGLVTAKLLNPAASEVGVEVTESE